MERISKYAKIPIFFSSIALSFLEVATIGHNALQKGTDYFVTIHLDVCLDSTCLNISQIKIYENTETVTPEWLAAH